MTPYFISAGAFLLKHLQPVCVTQCCTCLCFHHLCWIVKRLLSSDHFFREAEPETTFKTTESLLGSLFWGEHFD